MLIYKIPGRADIEIDNVVFDYNGTIAVDGKLIAGVAELMAELVEQVKVYVLTADTYGTVKKECHHMNVEVLTFPIENAGESKRKIVKQLKGERTLCVGNGFNDIAMFQEATLSVAVIEGEGACGKCLLNADIVTRSIVETISIILDQNKVKATLRN